MTPGEREDKTGGERMGKEKDTSKETVQQGAGRRFKRVVIHVASSAMWLSSFCSSSRSSSSS
ncbi:hypothetical protein BDZ89DRAFT_1056059 [Hymenopellis radicata]|nr:hypothetical protein BDZ89DRAFT_1056059 [Hymenopellis radicata]